MPSTALLRTSLLRPALALLLLVTLSSCIGLPKPPPPATVYQLQPPAHGLMAQPPALPAGTRLEIPEPGMAPGLDTERIALALEGGRKLDYYAGAKWAAPLPDVIQDIAIASLRQSLPGLSVDDDEHMSGATHRLRLQVQSFAPVYAAKADSIPEIRIAVRFALIRLSDDAIVTDITLGTRLPARANTLGAVTAALETGLHQVLSDAMARLAAPLAPAGVPVGKKNR